MELYQRQDSEIIIFEAHVYVYAISWSYSRHHLLRIIFSSFFSTLVEFPYVYAVRLGFRFLVRFISSKYIPVLLNIFQVFITQNIKVLRIPHKKQDWKKASSRLMQWISVCGYFSYCLNSLGRLFFYEKSMVAFLCKYDTLFTLKIQ